MPLPNVDEWMTSLSALQIVPPPKNPQHCSKKSLHVQKEHDVPPLQAADCQQRDDVPTNCRLSAMKSDANESTLKSPAQNNEREGVPSPAGVSKAATEKRRRQKRGEEISMPSTNTSSSTTPTRSPTLNSGSQKQKPLCENKSVKKISELLSSNNTEQYGNMIMVGTQRVYPRTLVQPTIYHNSATDLWIATIHTDANSIPTASDISTAEPKAKQKAFSFHDEKAARASAYANSPPVLIPFGTTSQCMLCDTSFTFLRRPKHCKNCGIIICGDCSTRWNTKMLPETYSNKSTLGLSKSVRVCVSCDAVAKRFKNALMMGRYDMAVEGFLTGNVNLRCPFVFKGEKEIMFPIHCAIIGQSERLLRWLVDVQCCPIHLTSTANKGKYEEDALPTIQTSKGRSVMDIAMEMKNVGVLKYLVNERGVSVYEVKDLALALGALESVINAFPEDVVDAMEEKDKGKTPKSKVNAKIKSPTKAVGKYHVEKSASPKRQSVQHSYSVVPYSTKEKTLLSRDIQPVKNKGLYGSIGRYDSDEDKNEHGAGLDSDDDNSVCTTVNELCTVCNEAPIDCVATPCGHQVCCMSCTENRIACPSCKVVCQFIEIYQP